MKKFITAILSATMVLAMALCLTGCGDSEESGEQQEVQTADQTVSEEAQAADQTDGEEAAASIFPEALEDVESYAIEDISNTGWQLSGGMIDGEEMEQADLDAVLAACGGALQLVFADDSSVQLINGETAYDGSYEYAADQFAIHAVFEGYEYYGVLTYIDEQPVLIIANTDAPGQALYLTQIEEG